jgi:hypothetical protein
MEDDRRRPKYIDDYDDDEYWRVEGLGPLVYCERVWTELK